MFAALEEGVRQKGQDFIDLLNNNISSEKVMEYTLKEAELDNGWMETCIDEFREGLYGLEDLLRYMRDPWSLRLEHNFLLPPIPPCTYFPLTLFSLMYKCHKFHFGEDLGF